MLTLTVTGNLADDPGTRLANSGKAVTNFLVISNERYRDRSGEWTDGKTTAVRVTIWGRDDGQPGFAERVAESLTKGDQVTVTGSKLAADAYLNRDGEAAATLDLTASDVQVSLRRHPVNIDWPHRSNGANGAAGDDPAGA